MRAALQSNICCNTTALSVVGGCECGRGGNDGSICVPPVPWGNGVLWFTRTDLDAHHS